MWKRGLATAWSAKSTFDHASRYITGTMRYTYDVDDILSVDVINGEHADFQFPLRAAYIALLINRQLALWAALEAAMHPVILLGNIPYLGFKELIGQQGIGFDVAARVVLQRLKNT